MMSTGAALLLIANGACTLPMMAPIMVGQAEVESGLNRFAIHDNTKTPEFPQGRGYYPDTAEQAIFIAHTLHAIGHTKLDLGIAQINMPVNAGWTGLDRGRGERDTLERAFDPCLSFAAGEKVYFVKYRGNPPDAMKIAYAEAVRLKIAATAQVAPSAKASPPARIVPAATNSRPAVGRFISYGG